MADGLDSLTAMRTKTPPSKRAVPPPRGTSHAVHPLRCPARAASNPTLRPPRPGEADAERHTDLKAGATRTDRPPAAANNSDLTKVSIYLDEQSDAYLETVRSAARNTRPRVDATRSAVVRLALTRLADELDAAEVIAELQRNAAGHTGPGRKRG